VLGVLVPEVERAVAASCAERAVLRMERDGVDREDFGDVARGGVLLAVALEGEVEAGRRGLAGVGDSAAAEGLLT
jgi:hypothetical protein